jgi:hypothetical protein
MSEREKGSNILTSVPNSLFSFNSSNTSIYSPLSKTSRYGPIAPFLRTRGRSAIQARTVHTRIPMTINSYKNVRAFKNDLRTVCPSRSDGPRYIKLSQKEVLLTLHICCNLYCGRSTKQNIVLRMVRTQASDGLQFKKENQYRTSRVLSKH